MAAAQYRANLPVLETDRLSLRAPEMSDFAAWHHISKQAFGDSEKEAWEQFANYTACWLLHGHGLFTVIRKTDCEILGFVTFGLEWEDHEPEMGYMFDAAHHARGYATEAATAVRDFGFDLLGHGGFVSYVSAKNAASNALANRLGASRDAEAEANFGPDQHVWRHGSPQ